MDQFKPATDVSALRSTLTDDMNKGKTEGIKLPSFDQNENEQQQENDVKPVEQQNTDSDRKPRAKRKVDSGKAAMTFDKKGKVIFNGPINWDAHNNPEIQTVAGSHFYFRQESLKLKYLAAENELSLLEIIHVIVADAIENGLPEEMLERYLNARSDFNQ